MSDSNSKYEFNYATKGSVYYISNLFEFGTYDIKDTKFKLNSAN